MPVMTAATFPDPRPRRSITFRSLTLARQQLLTCLQRLNFGRLERLEVCDGEPVISAEVFTIREVKFSGENGPRQESSLGDFVLKDQQRALMTLLDEIGNGMLLTLTCKHGCGHHSVSAIAAVAVCTVRAHDSAPSAVGRR